jgi:hypothetical protein
MKLLAAGLFGLFALLSASNGAYAHALEPGYLELQVLGEDTWRAFWRKPAVGSRPMRIDASLPQNCKPRTPPEARFDGRAYVARWIAKCPGGLAGGEIAIPGLSSTKTDVLVRYELEQGSSQTQRLTPAEPAFTIPETRSTLNIIGAYFSLGVDHIAGGYDHLLFVFALLMLIRDRWRLVGAITAFTVAHSLTLAAAALGWLVVPAPPVEAIIALSIMFLASEVLARKGSVPRLSERYPWIVTFAFGLLHGLGFARALLDIGLPRHDVPLALLAFNLGVEAGQLMFVAVCVVLGVAFLRFAPSLPEALARAPRPVVVSTAYAIGGMSAYWFIERIAQF